MKILSTKWFKKWYQKVNLSNQDLIKAINNLENRLSSANLGNYLFKIRVKRQDSGKSAGFRTIVIYQKNDKAIFIYGFGKNEKSNFTKSEFQYFKRLAYDFSVLKNEQLEQLVKQKRLFDIEALK